MDLDSLAKKAYPLGLFVGMPFHSYLDLFSCKLRDVHHTTSVQLGHQPKQGLMQTREDAD